MMKRRSFFFCIFRTHNPIAFANVYPLRYGSFRKGADFLGEDSADLFVEVRIFRIFLQRYGSSAKGSWRMTVSAYFDTLSDGDDGDDDETETWEA